jgi:hypothetical protein
MNKPPANPEAPHGNATDIAATFTVDAACEAMENRQFWRATLPVRIPCHGMALLELSAE